MSGTIHDAVAAYALGALDAGEAVAFEAHLSVCHVCREELARYRETVAALAEAVPEVSPPPHVRERVLERARAARADGPAAAAAPSAPAARPAPRPRLRFALAAAAAIAAVGLFGWWSNRSRVVELRARVATLEATNGQQAAELAARDSLLALALGVDVREAHLVSTDRPPSARLIWSPSRAQVVLSVAQLPPAPEGRTYQLWGIPSGGTPVSLGVFDTGADGSAVVALTIPAELSFDVTAVSEEPTGGSPGPTTQPFLVGRISD